MLASEASYISGQRVSIGKLISPKATWVVSSRGFRCPSLLVDVRLIEAGEVQVAGHAAGLVRFGR